MRHMGINISDYRASFLAQYGWVGYMFFLSLDIFPIKSVIKLVKIKDVVTKLVQNKLICDNIFLFDGFF
jgi:hypothetical protein